MSARTRDPLEALGHATGGGPALAERELWPRLALGLLALLVVALIYLGSRPGGRGPIWVFTRGRDLLSLAALAVLLYGLVHSALRRPFLAPGRARGFVALVLVTGIAPYPFPYPTSWARRPSTVAFRLPVEGSWRVLWGGEAADGNRVVTLAPDRCTALILVRDEDLARLGAGEAVDSLQDWAAYGSTLLAPADGRVVRVRDGIPDGHLGRPSAVSRDHSAFGNALVLEVAAQQFLFLTHLRQGSIRVAEGELVTAGTPLAQVGASGLAPLTPVPHVAIHLQDTSEEAWGEGIPWTLTDYIADGLPVERDMPQGGLGPGGAPRGPLVRAGPP